MLVFSFFLKTRFKTTPWSQSEAAARGRGGGRRDAPSPPKEAGPVGTADGFSNFLSRAQTNRPENVFD